LAVVLAYRALGLGDFLTGVPAYRALRRTYPDARLILAAPKALAPLAELTRAIDEVVDTPPLGPAPSNADLAVNLHGKGPQSHALLKASNPKRLIAVENWDPHEHEVVRWCRLLHEHGIPADPEDLDLDPPPTPSPVPGATVIHPGAASPARRWPRDRFEQLARHYDNVAITGNPDEAIYVPGATDLTGKTDLLTLASVIAHAGLVICGDTGVAHLATAFGTPSIVLFGPTPPSEWGPPPQRTQHRALWAGRRGDPHGQTPDPGLLEIQVDDVLAVGSTENMSLTDKATGRIKKAAGDLADDASLRQEGRNEERKGEAKEDLAQAQEKADEKADEVADLERKT
jgi:ADP-heptose:LPS heptosyltransferase